MHSPIIVRRVNIRGKRPNKKSQENAENQYATALSVLPDGEPLQPLSPAPASEQVVPHPPRKRKPYGLAIAAAMLASTPILYALDTIALMLIFSGEVTWDIVIGLTLIGCVLFNIGSLLLYLTARATNYMRKPVALVSLELLVLQIGTFMIYRGDLTDLLDMQHPLLAISLLSLILLCMIALCVFSVLMLAHLLPKRQPRKTPA